MAIRLRTVNGVRVALCAAETDVMPDDIYLDDGDHYALVAKFCQDHNTGLKFPTEWKVMESQKLRDAEEACAQELAYGDLSVVTLDDLKYRLESIEFKLGCQLLLPFNADWHEEIIKLDLANLLPDSKLSRDWKETRTRVMNLRVT